MSEKTIKIRNGGNLQTILDDYLPGESREFQEAVLWECTGWPAFWRGDPEDCLRMQLAVVADALRTCLPSEAAR